MGWGEAKKDREADRRLQGTPDQRVWHGRVVSRAGALLLVELEDGTAPPVDVDVQVVVE